MEHNTIGYKIQLLREEKNLTQKELAELIEITDAAMSRYENGKREPKAKIVSKLAKIFNVTTDYLLEIDSNPNIVFSFSNIFKNLRLNNKLSQKEIALILNVSTSTIGMWEQNRRSPDKEMLIKISAYFNVSVDYLLGCSNLNLKTTNFAERFKELRIANSKTQKKIADIFFKSYTSISKYENGKAMPEHTLLRDMADYFNVSIDYLLGRTDERVEKNDTYDFLNKNLKINLNGNDEELNQDELDNFINYLDDLGINVEKILKKIKTNKTNER